MSSRLSDSCAAFNSSRAACAASRSVSNPLPSVSLIVFSVAKIVASTSFLRSTSSLRFASASAFASASFIILSISSSDKPELDWITIVCSLFVPISFALTDTIPFLSISNVTSICGIPRGAAGISDNWKRPSVLLSAAIGRSP